MRKILSALFLVLGVVGMHAQTVNIYQSGTMIYTCSDADSIVACEVAMPQGRFSVSENKQVCFAHGNLQYTQSTKTWSFAEHQYDYIGEGNLEDVKLPDCIDMFGWSGNNTKAPFGVSASKVNSQYSGDFVDWGTNAIDTFAPGTWHTLTIDEWLYLYKGRTNCEHLRTIARINLNDDGSEFANGTIFLPDNWISPAGMDFKIGLYAGNERDYSKAYADFQTLSLTDWRILETAGAVFLPASGMRFDYVSQVEKEGDYWSATPNDETQAYASIASVFRFREHAYSRYVGCAVRLVRDADSVPTDTTLVPTMKVYKDDKVASIPNADSVIFVKTPLPADAFSVGAERYVSFARGNLQYQPSTRTWRLAEHQYDYIGEGNNNLSDTYDGWIDLFGWSTDSMKVPFGAGISKDSADYQGNFVDWGTNIIGTDTTNTWRTLTIDEWRYLLHERENADALFGFGMVDSIEGIILLPDTWQPIKGVIFNSSSVFGLEENSEGYYETSRACYSDNVYTLENWKVMEEKGHAIFLPAAEYRDGQTMGRNGKDSGCYWSSSAADNARWAGYLLFVYDEEDYTFTLAHNFQCERYFGLSVRLVQNIRK